MRIIYYTQPFFSDCDFPLIRELQKRNLKLRVYIPLQECHIHSGIIEVSKLKKHIGIYKASQYEDFKIFDGLLDLKNIYIINLPNNRSHISDRIIWIAVFLHMLLFRPQVFHFNWHFSGRQRWLLKLPVRKCMTVHDPVSHSSVTNENEEKQRIEAFLSSDRFLLLSDALKKEFSEKYNIIGTRIDLTHLGEYSFLRYIDASSSKYPYPYVLFFGQIQSHKGIEYLCQAMTQVHRVYPNIHLIIAGRGDLYFDFSEYANLSYINLINDFISARQLSALLKNALFAVCPYKDATQSGVVQTAFSCDTPLIVTNVGNMMKVVHHEETGLVVPPCDVNSLGEAMIELIGKPEKLNRFKVNIKEQWRPSMGWYSIADDYICTYRRLLNER